MKKLIFVFLLVFSNGVIASQQTIKLKLIGMYCSMCPVTIKTALDMSDGVEEVKVKRDPDSATVLYDDTVTGPDLLIKVVQDAGYDAELLVN